MQTEILSTAEATALYDYLVVINPDAQIAREVRSFKEQIAAQLGIFTSRYSKAHISLFRSVFPEKFQDDCIALLNEIAHKQSGFTVYTSKFDHFNHGTVKRTIYLNVANPKPIAELQKKILQQFELKPKDFKPHITVARAISTDEFNQVYPMFDNQLFVRSFNCTSFLLLRKPAAGGVYELVKEFTFGGNEQRQRHRTLFNYAA
ncbi:MAG TPA: 2'-5' RNA ligase family protein [Chitinophaga sp.]|uniref:2'-5' RNA ligase family protein n=1 Tax=Chitinophaga sp. TaxID=1869181 RepID=UPI002DBD7DC6|nr:2'-5' RNA ligase family protein [Chitinophaga sp.]HEU4555716.1 2'-5' RNA ligase family protein [Chitinophaga sp.]